MVVGDFTINDSDKKYVQWMNDIKIKLKKCSIGYFNGSRGAIATENISVGDVVISVPDDAVLLADNEDSFLHEDLRETLFGHRDVTNTRNESIGLALVLMGEKLLGSHSRWSGYIQSLPSTLGDFPANWTPEQQALLKNSCLRDMPPYGIALDDWAGAEDLFEELFQQAVMSLKPRFEQIKTVGKHGLQVAREVVRNEDEDEDAGRAGKRRKTGPKVQIESLSATELRDLFRWALTVVSSYSFELGDEMFHGLVPFFDMLNHHTLGVNVRLNHDAKTGCLQMIATQPISKGEELVNSYGPHSQIQLLRNYGYVEPALRKTSPFHSSFARVPQFVSELLKRPFVDASGADQFAPLDFDDVMEVLQLLHSLSEVHLTPKNGWIRLAPIAAHASISGGELPEGHSWGNVDKDDIKTIRGDFDEFLFCAYLTWAASFEFRKGFVPLLSTVALGEDRVGAFMTNDLQAEALLKTLLHPSPEELAKAASDEDESEGAQVADLKAFFEHGLPSVRALLKQRAELLEAELKTVEAENKNDDAETARRRSIAAIVIDCEIQALNGVVDRMGELTPSILEEAFRRHVLFAKHKIEEECPDLDDEDEDGSDCCDDEDCEGCDDHDHDHDEDGDEDGEEEETDDEDEE